MSLPLALSCGRGRQLIRPGPPKFKPGTWSFVILPDTQKYASRHPDIFLAQTNWIVEKHKELAIRFVLHEGDIVDRNKDKQWLRASEALHQLDAYVPYVLAPGNHDYPGNAKHREGRTSEFFPPAHIEFNALATGLYEAEKVDNSYRIIDTPSGPWLLIALEFGPRDGVLRWADAVLKSHPDVPAMIVTHAYLYHDGTRYDWDRTRRQRDNPYRYGVAEHEEGVNDGQDIWEELVAPNPNVVFVFSGHVLGDGVARRTTKREGMPPVHEIVANYQMRRKGGGGFLRVVQMDPATQKARVLTYSPYLDATSYGPADKFTLDLSETLGAP